VTHRDAELQTGGRRGAFLTHMKRRSPALKVANPCNADWGKMSGDDAIRHCGECDKNVYHLSYMTNEQVEELLGRAGEAPCIRFFQRTDGTILLGDCPVGAKATRRKRTMIGAGAALVSAVGLALYPGVAGSSNDKEPDGKHIMGKMIVRPLPEKVKPAPQPDAPKTKPDKARPVMGKFKR